MGKGDVDTVAQKSRHELSREDDRLPSFPLHLLDILCILGLSGEEDRLPSFLLYCQIFYDDVV
jgi:hypothetical protein